MLKVYEELLATNFAFIDHLLAGAVLGLSSEDYGVLLCPATEATHPARQRVMSVAGNTAMRATSGSSVVQRWKCEVFFLGDAAMARCSRFGTGVKEFDGRHETFRYLFNAQVE